jgi:hypothetical protein
VISIPGCKSVYVNIESSVACEIFVGMFIVLVGLDPSTRKFSPKVRKMIGDQAGYVNVVRLLSLACLVVLELSDLFESGFAVTKPGIAGAMVSAPKVFQTCY